MAMTKIKGLQMWCRKMTDGYPNVDIANFTSAWRDGLAFCAIIHRFRPDLIDFDSLSSENVLHNNKLAFEVAEKELNIPAFLEAEDMARLKVPDKLSVITYVSQYYNFLNALPQLGGPGVKGAGAKKATPTSGVKRAPPDANVDQAPSNKKTVKNSIALETTKQEKSSPPRQNTIGDKCAICQNKVYLLERHIEDGKLYHRSCFRHSELSPTNKVFTRSPFLSPSLNSEKAAQENHVQKKTNRDVTPLSALSPRQGENAKIQDNTPLSKDTAKSNLSSVLKRVEGAGSKHSLGASDREEESKKSKFNPKTLFKGKDTTTVEPKHKGDDSSKPTINEKLDSDFQSMPLSSKEARKLEKRKQEIADSEKAIKNSAGAKRAMPLVFQQKDAHSTPSTSTSSSTSSVSPSSTSMSKMSTTVPSNNKSGLVSSKIGLSALQSQKDNAHDKAKPSVNNNAENGASPSVLRKQSAPNIANLQQKFSGGNANDTKTPVAKPRISATKDILSKGPAADPTYAVLRSQENVPRPAPRKSVAETIESRVAPPRPKSSPRQNLMPSSNDSSSYSSGDEKSNTPRSSSSTSPPPPLPTSPPPSLPESQPPSLQQSAASKSLSQSPRQPPPLPSSLPPSLPSKDPRSGSSSSTAATSAVSNSSAVSQGRLHTHKNVVTKDNKATSLSQQPMTSSISSSSGSEDPPVAVLVTPVIKKDDSTVLSGLLSSLAGIRGRSASTPLVEVPSSVPTSKSTTGSGLSMKPTTSTSPSSSSSSTAPSSSTNTQTTFSHRKQSEPIIPSSLKLASSSTNAPASQTKNNSVSIHLTPGANNTNVPKYSSKPTNTVVSSSSKTSGTEKVPEVLSVLSSLKPVSSSSSNADKTSKPSLSSSSSSSSSANTRNIDVKLKANSQNDSKLITDTKMKMGSGGAVKSSSNPNENAVFMKDVQLKRVMPEPKTKVEEAPDKVPPFNVALKKVEPPISDAPRKKSPERPQATQGVKSVVVQVNKDKPRDDKIHSTSKEPMVNKDDDSVPQWKKDIEERKKKLREDIARSEANTPSSYAKRPKERPKSTDVLTLINDSKEEKPAPLSSTSESPRSDISSSSVSSSSSSKGRPRSVTESSSDSDRKLEWQLEAERRIAAFATFDSSEDESKSASLGNIVNKDIKSQHDKLPQNTHRGTNFENDRKPPQVSQPKKIDLTGNLKSENITKPSDKINNVKEVNNKFKGPNFELKTVDIDISGGGENTERKTGLKNANVYSPRKENTAKVSHLESISVNSSNNNNHDKVSRNTETKSHIKGTFDESPITITTSKLPLSTLSGTQTTHEKTIDAEIEAGKKSKDQSKSPQLKKKISVLGKEDNDPKTPPNRRKITPDRDFNFDNNSVTSEFEASLTQSTADLNLQDNKSDNSSPAQLTPQRPPRPRSDRRKSSPRQISAIELQQQLMEIDSRLTDLELRGRDLEDSIRNVNTLEEDDEELMIQWFTLVREKNDLVREEADLVYLSREQDLEDEQQQIDSQLRYLMTKEEFAKSPQEKEEEDYLLQRKINIVNQRSSIVDSIDEDRLRYEEEDREIEDVLLEKGLIRNARGSLMANKGLKVAKSKFYA